MMLRKVIFWLHLTVGLIAGSIVLIMSVTGVLLAFERQITEWADRDLRVDPVAPATLRLSIDSLVAAVRTVEPEAVILGFTLRSDSAAPAAFNLDRDRTLFVNCSTGAVLGEGSTRARAFFRIVTSVHRWLGLPDEKRDMGRAITGACNLAFLFLVSSGFYLWWPLKWTKSAGRMIVWPKAKPRGPVRNFQWHNAVGFWSAPFLFLIVLSGICMSYPWATNLLYRRDGK